MGSEAKQPPIKIAVIDTGFSPLFGDTSYKHLCRTGHYDFTTNRPVQGLDSHGHGSFVVKAINDTLTGLTGFCYQVFKITPNGDPVILTKAAARAYRSGARFINFSVYSRTYSSRFHETLKSIGNRGVKIFVAAGNSNRNLNNVCKTYPNCFKGVKNMYVVGSVDEHSNKASYSNYGSMVAIYEKGRVLESTGTSFAAPTALGKQVRELLK